MLRGKMLRFVCEMLQPRWQLLWSRLEMLWSRLGIPEGDWIQEEDSEVQCEMLEFRW